MLLTHIKFRTEWPNEREKEQQRNISQSTMHLLIKRPTRLTILVTDRIPPCGGPKQDCRANNGGKGSAESKSPGLMDSKIFEETTESASLSDAATTYFHLA